MCVDKFILLHGKNVKLLFQQEFRKNEAIIKQEKDQWKDQVLASKQEIEKLRGKCN